jgi:hypothetical protein
MARLITPNVATAAALTSDTSRLVTLRNDILDDPTLSAIPNDPDNNQRIADAYNLAAVPDYWVWRTWVPESEYTDLPSVDGTNWSWPAFIARSIGEQTGWARMFITGGVNPSRAGVRQGFADIFSGTQNNAPAQRTHMTTVSRRRATRAEKLFAVATTGGTGTVGGTANPATMTVEGPLDRNDIEAARRQP